MRVDTSETNARKDRSQTAVKAGFFNRRAFWAALFAAFLLTRGLFAFRGGVVSSPDSRLYGIWGDQLLAAHFNYATFLREAHSTFPPVLYTGFVTVVALLKILLRDGWSSGLVCLNVLAQSLLGVLIAWMVKFAVERSAVNDADGNDADGNDADSGEVIPARFVGNAVLVTAGLYGCAFDILVWTRYVLTDSLAMLLFWCAFIAIVLYTADFRVQWRGRDGKRDATGGSKSGLLLGTAIFLVMASIFFRPTGVLLLPLLPLAWILKRRDRGPAPLPALLGTVGVGALAIVCHSWLMEHPTAWPLKTLSGTINVNAAHYRLGEVVWDRPRTFHAPPVELGDYISIALDRLIHFFYFLQPDFSRSHNLLNAVFFMPLYLLAGWTLWCLVFRSQVWSETQRKILLLSCAAVAITSLFHGLVQVDYDWRYRLPVLPHLIFLAGFGLTSLCASASPRASALLRTSALRKGSASVVTE